MIGKQIITIRPIVYYGGVSIEKGIYGVIEDFKSPYFGILWNNSIRGYALLGTDIVLVEYQNSLKYILDNLLSSIVKAESAPCSSYTHLAQAVDALYKIAGDYVASTDEYKEELANVLEHMRLLRGS